MTRIAMIGAGSAGFCRTLVQDILQFDSLKNAHIVLMDIDAGRLDGVFRAMKRMKEQHSLPCRFSATTDRRAAVKDARFVISMIQVGGLAPYELDIKIPLAHGVDQCVGDTLGPGGVFRGLRHVAALREVVRDMAEVSRNDAIFINYANPMAIVSWALARAVPEVTSVGLCHSVQHTGAMLCTWLGVNPRECDIVTSGINHMAWFLKLAHKGTDLYPKIWRKLDKEGPIAGEEYRFEMMKATGYFMTESPGHLSEYLPYFRTRKDVQRLFGGKGFSGETGAYLRMCREGLKKYAATMAAWSSGKQPVPFTSELSLEYAAPIMNAVITGLPFRFAGNVLNKGYIPNLPHDCCVEVPVFADSDGLHGSFVGALPPQCAALCRTNINVQELAVNAALEGNYEAAYHACLLDPLTGAALAPHEIRNMVDEMFAAQKRWLPQFKGKKRTYPGHRIGRIATGSRQRLKGKKIKVKRGHYD